ncbi:hypothetical protein ABZ721_10955 [Streptomyces sp. NPDC006733]|uniref:hypothetical protein n=1 Tax=Streptomyces sp. NPDC006733 TaxID=3155460 RepID=UPI0033E99916
MKRVQTATAATVAAAGVVTALLVRRQRPEATDRWLTVTVQRDPSEVEKELPSQLTSAADAPEIRIRPASGGRGTELAVRPRSDAEQTAASRDRLRTALRDAKSLLETGEILEPDGPSEHRRTTPTGNLMDRLTRRASTEGVL